MFLIAMLLNFIICFQNLADSLSDSTDSANSVIIHLLVDGFKITDRLMTTPTQSLWYVHICQDGFNEAGQISKWCTL